MEPGILRFDLAVDQSDPNVIHVYAVYEDEAAYAFHQQQPYYKELMEKILPCFSRPPEMRVTTNLLPRDDDWARIAASRHAKLGRPPARAKTASLRKPRRAKTARPRTAARPRKPGRKKRP